MTASELRQKYFDFFVSKGHKLIPSSSLIPENDSTALFISAGMQPLVPYLLGEPHPLGKRLVSVQKCLRTDDIDEVGDNVHHTFFEMLGNWSLGDYFKKEMIPWSYEFLTSDKYLGIPKEKLAVTVFAGDGDAPFDKESYAFWLGLGISESRIAKLPKKNNWWGPVGNTGPCGPDSEMFYWTGKENAPANFDPNDSKWVEIWNDVFMEYVKKEDGSYEISKQKNVDTGMGLERTLAVLNDLDDNYKTDLFWPIIEKLQEPSGKKYEDNKREFRIISDHLKAAAFLIADGVEPSNVQRGYVLRRLIRRSVRQGHVLGIQENFTTKVIEILKNIYQKEYPELSKPNISEVLNREEEKFRHTLVRGLKEFEKAVSHLLTEEGDFILTEDGKKNALEGTNELSGKIIFDLYTTYGFPLELIKEIATEKGLVIREDQFKDEMKRHQELSRTASAGMFKGGLADNSEIVTKYHTATHLLQAALRQVLNDNVHQAGSNITAERLRFDFSSPEKLTPEQLSEVERLVNEAIEKNQEIKMEVMDFEKAIESGALTVPGEKYPEKVKVYSIGNFSIEVCGGPHADFTGSLGKLKITKEESAGAGIRRIYAVLE